MYKNNADNIYDIVNSLVGSTILQTVYNYDVKQVDAYPYAKISVRNGVGNFLDTTNNQMTSEYAVTIINENKNISISEGQLRQLVDSVIIELHKKENITLEGTVLSVLPITTQWGWDETNESIRMCEIIVEVRENILV